MRLTDFNYKKLVIAAYRRRRAEKKLSMLLADPKRANIRQECVLTFRERYNEAKDAEVLRTFFGPIETEKQGLKIIGEFNLDRFRQLQKFLRDDKENITGKNLELLAWLIDFPHRPYLYGMMVILNDEEKLIVESDVVDDREEIGEGVADINEEDDEEIQDVETGNETIEEEVPMPEAGKEIAEVKPDGHPLQISGPINLSTKKSLWKRWSAPLRRVAAVLLVAASVGGLYMLEQKDGNKVVTVENPYLTDLGSVKKTIEPVPKVSTPNYIPRCKATTKKGTRCKRSANKTGFCWQHDDID